ncbi:MAG: hypothetical protein K6G00_11885 [Treponema sp.]|nr:hypothetical protein [Treponema sp.]
MNNPLFISYPGVICSAGTGRDSLWQAVTLGLQDGMKKIKAEDKEFFAARIEDVSDASDARYDMKITRIEKAAVEQIDSVIRKALDLYGKDRIAVCVGSCDNGSEFSVAAHKTYFNAGTFPSSYELEMQGASYVATYVKELYEIKGPCLAFSTACSSSATAMVKACQLIQGGIVDAVIVGGVDIASDTVLLGFNALEAVSSEKTNPFSKNRHGITLGDGAAFFVLSKENLVQNMPAVLIAGYGESSDAHHITSPDPSGDGAVRAMKSALDCAQIESCQIDYLNLHGTGTVFNDAMEAKAVNYVFGDYAVPCSSTKSETGHTLGAAGALELAVCYETIVRNMGKENVRLPLQCWDKQKDNAMPELCIVDSDYHANKNVSSPIQYCMTNSFAFGGANVSLIIASQAIVPQKLGQEALAELLPHRGKMRLLNRVTEHDITGKTLTGECDINENCIFYDKRIKGIPNWAAFEILAQGISALAAVIRASNRMLDKSRAGVVLSVSDYKAYIPVLGNGKTVIVKVKEDYGADDVFQYTCILYVKEDSGQNETKAVSAKITVMEMKNMKEALCQMN